MLNIDEIQNGIVIDHIKAGTAVGLMELLGITGNKTANVALIQNARSHKADCGRKDIIKVEGGADKLKGKAEQISVGTNFDQSGFGWAKGCPADPEIPLGFVQQSFTIPFSRICGPLEALSLAGVGITLLGCLVWVIGGKKA